MIEILKELLERTASNNAELNTSPAEQPGCSRNSGLTTLTRKNKLDQNTGHSFSRLTCHPPRWSSCQGCGRWWRRWWRPAPRSPCSRAWRGECTRPRTPARRETPGAGPSRSDPSRGSPSGPRTSSGAERCGRRLSGRGKSASCSWCSLVSCHSGRSVPPYHLDEREESGDLACQQYHIYCPRESGGPPEILGLFRSHCFSRTSTIFSPSSDPNIQRRFLICIKFFPFELWLA